MTVVLVIEEYTNYSVYNEVEISYRRDNKPDQTNLILNFSF
jgi:hypothetical protein